MVVKKEKQIPFEAALQRLEAIVDQLESGDVPLEEAVKLFEEGIGLRKHCLALLKDAEERVKFLAKGKDGQGVETEPPEGWEAETEDDDVR